MKKHDWVIAGDPDIGDRYLCQVAKELRAGGLAKNPVCRIKEVRRYPIQHAVIWTDVAHECPPLRFGGLYSLRVFGPAEPGPGTEEAWQESLREALRKALETTDRPEERAILARHLEGDFRGGRGIKRWKEWEL